ncbi:MAG: hypothetical protein CV087_08145 [Candidatus Brocadia sp. WS118]|nr:MAG: hypothetical protein CV087_08145 [Candidatus Brocadia sp. WS118]
MTTYTVKAGDTLSKIAKFFYGDESRYNLIAEANSISNPSNIFIGQVLQIPFLTPTVVAEAFNINDRKFRLDRSRYFPESQQKQMIVLHFTAGPTAKSAFNTFQGSRSKVATPYILDHDGTIYEIFPPQCWALHLFKHTPGESPDYYQLEKVTVPIEIVNVGPLKPDRNDPNQLNWWLPDPQNKEENFATKWCMISETDRYVARSYRGIDYFAAFTDQQYESLKDFIPYLCERFDISKQAPSDKLKADIKFFLNFRGIVSHQNFRQDKWDIGPAFDWSRIGL